MRAPFYYFRRLLHAFVMPTIIFAARQWAMSFHSSAIEIPGGSSDIRRDDEADVADVESRFYRDILMRAPIKRDWQILLMTLSTCARDFADA